MSRIARAGSIGLWLLSCAAVQAATLRLDGEVVARESAALIPPTIEQLWQLNITELLPEGSAVTTGMPVVAFDGSLLQTQLQQKQAELNERRTQQQQLRQQLAERERNESLLTEQARAERDKARRKAEQPAELVRRVDYQKLVVDRELAERRFERMVQREALAARLRDQELRLLQAQTAVLEREAAALEAAIASMTLYAPRDGVMLHRTNWQGEKFEVGSQTWRGQAVAEIPDPTTLEVRAVLPEPELRHVRVGASVTIRVDGSGQRLAGEVTELGRVVRSRSRLQPVPVIDVGVRLIDSPGSLRPGQAVRVELQYADND